jgi:2-phosphoglycerate kinase
MPETTVIGRRHGLPYSKGLMAQSLSASGLTPQRAYELAQVIERRLAERPGPDIGVDELRDLAAEVLREEEGEDAVRRFRDWQRVDRLERPLVVLLAGAPGVGKSTLATMLAGRLGITRVIATDAIRQVIRAFFSRDFMPAVHVSSFEAGATLEPDDVGGDADLVAFARQAETVRTGVMAIVERAAQEQAPMVVEGVHLVPGLLPPDLGARCIPVHAVLAVSDEELHRGHFSLRGAERPASRYLDRFDKIRKLQDYLVRRAQVYDVPVIDNLSLDDALPQAMALVLDAVSSVTPRRGAPR